MARKGENIRKRKDGRYEARYKVGYRADGKIQYRSLYAHTYAEVKRKLHEAVGGAMQCKTRSALTMDRVLSDWLADTQIRVKPSTYARYRTVVETHLRPVWGALRAHQMEAKHLEGMAQTLSKSKQPKTVADILSVAGQVLNYAADRGYCERIESKVRALHTQPEMKILNAEEQEILTKWLLQSHDRQKAGVLLCLYTGLRLGEVCALRWEDVDLAEGVIQVRRTVQRISDGKGGTRFLMDSPKTRSSLRRIPIPGFLVGYLASLQGTPGTYILTGSGEFTQPRTYQNRFKRYLRECHLPDFRFHALRHTFASRAIELGFDPKALSEILGHAGVSITLNRYVHSSDDWKRTQMERFSGLI